MAEIVFAVPVLPGKEELDRRTMEEMAESRRDEYEAALREAGVTRQAVWHQETPDGTLALPDLKALRKTLAVPGREGRFPCATKTRAKRQRL